MEFNTGMDILMLIIIAMEIWMVLDNTRSINEEQERGIIVENKVWRAICFLHKPYEKHLSYVSVVFLVIGYTYFFLTIPLFILSFCAPSALTSSLVPAYVIVIFITAIVERLFMPPYGGRGH